MGNGTTKKVVLLAVFLVMLGGLYLGVTYMGGDGHNLIPPPTPTAPKLDPTKLAAQWPQIVTHAAAPARGDTKTAYTIAEFGDFQCPQCGKARPFLEALIKKYPSQVNLIFVHRPFAQLHQWAIPAGQASEIAATQGKFWPMYDVLYGHQDDLETGYYGDYAALAGVNKANFKKAFDAGQGLEKVKTATAFSDMIGIQMTPTILIHDNVKNSVKIYMGLDGTKMPNGTPQYPGVKDLISKPPWNG